MTENELTLLNLGESLDNLANLDPRGYGVCKVLYKASRNLTGKPLCLNAAEKIIDNLKENDTVFILTGFVLSPYGKAETDGAISAVLLANALKKGLDVDSVIVCPEEAVQAVGALKEFFNLNCDISVFTKDKNEAEMNADKLISKYNPKAVISIECPGEDENGRYHNARGADVTDLQAKQDVLFDKLKENGVLNITIGDLGNEIGMSAISECLQKEIPVVPARTVTDNVITSTVSDWGCYSVIAMLSFMLENPDIMHGADVQRQVMKIACENGLIDMYGEHIPAIDGFDDEITCDIVKLMKELVIKTLDHRGRCGYWFEKMIELKENSDA